VAQSDEILVLAVIGVGAFLLWHLMQPPQPAPPVYVPTTPPPTPGTAAQPIVTAAPISTARDVRETFERGCFPPIAPLERRIRF